MRTESRIGRNGQRRHTDRTAAVAIIERLEDRWLRADWELTTYTDLRDELWDVGWSVLYGTVQVGNAAQEIASMEIGGANAWTYSYASLDDNGSPFDSGWRQFYFHADVSNGSVYWSVEGMPHVSHAGSQSYTSVTEVLVVAAVGRPGMRMSWDGLGVTIRESWGLQGPAYYHGSLTADTFGETHAGAQQQQVLHVHAPVDGLNEVIVEGYVRLEAKAGVQPGAEDIFGQVLIRAV